MVLYDLCQSKTEIVINQYFYISKVNKISLKLISYLSIFLLSIIIHAYLSTCCNLTIQYGSSFKVKSLDMLDDEFYTR
jgi:hypothetical protein